MEVGGQGPTGPPHFTSLSWITVSPFQLLMSTQTFGKMKKVKNKETTENRKWEELKILIQSRKTSFNEGKQQQPCLKLHVLKK